MLMQDKSRRPYLTILIFFYVCFSTVSGFSDGSRLAKGSATTRKLYCNRQPNRRDPMHFHPSCNGYCAPRSDFEQFYNLTVSNATYWLDVVRVNISAKPNSGKSVTGFSVYAIDESGHVAGSFVEDDTDVVVGTCNDLITVTDETHAGFHKMADHSRKNVSIQWQPDGYNHGRVKIVLWVVNNHSDIYFVEYKWLTSQKHGSDTLDIGNTLDKIVSAIDIDMFENTFKYRSTKGYNLDLTNPFSAFSKSPSKIDLVPVNLTRSSGISNLTVGNSIMDTSQPGGRGTNTSSMLDVASVNASGMNAGKVHDNRDMNAMKLNNANDTKMLILRGNNSNSVNDTSMHNITDAKSGNVNDTKLGNENGTSMGNVNDTNLNMVNGTTIGNVNDTKFDNVKVTSMGNVNDTKLGNENGTSLGNVNDINLNKVNGTTMGNVNDTKFDNVKGTSMGNVNDTKLGNENGTGMNNMNDTNLNKVNGTSIGNVNDTKFDNVKGTSMGNVNDTKLGNENGTSMGNVNDTNLNKVNGTTMDNVNDTKFDNVKGTSMGIASGINLNNVNGTSVGNANDTKLDNVNRTSMGNANDTNLNNMNGTSMGNVNDTNPYGMIDTNMNSMNDTILKNLTFNPVNNGSQTTQLNYTTNLTIPTTTQIPVVGNEASQLKEPDSSTMAKTPISTTSNPYLNDSPTTTIGNKSAYPSTSAIPNAGRGSSQDEAASGNPPVLNTSGNSGTTSSWGPSVSGRATAADAVGYSTANYQDIAGTKNSDISTTSLVPPKDPSSDNAVSLPAAM